MTVSLILVLVLTALIHLINTLIYSARWAGVKTGRLATAYSLFNIIFLIASTANTVQAPLLSSLVERTINQGLAALGSHLPDDLLLQMPVYQHELHLLEHQIRWVILSATLGTVVGGVLLPPFVRLFSRTILLFEEVGSVPRLFFLALSPRRFWNALKVMRPASPGSLRRVMAHKLGLPKGFLLLNIFISGIYTTGVLSALYAGALFPHYRTTATLLSPIVNGVATVLLAMVVDPTAAVITDQALQGKREEKDVRQMVAYLAITRFLGTILAQLLFVPSAWLIRAVAELLV
ncbi:lipid II flippase Amj family protein [Desulfothermobacter acidiphilus]|uniref:lipid II flippase Amj family protein n=1 Tax=Desulfothermobacter acidiphilus TaxID=1938353 RepID=UPI003F8B6878